MRSTSSGAPTAVCGVNSTIRQRGNPGAPRGRDSGRATRLASSHHPSIVTLATFDPPVQNHDLLRRSADYNPSMPADLEREATDKHRQLARAYRRWAESESETTELALLRKLAQLLYVVRSNIAHGEKFLRARDLEVCAVTVPVLEAIVDSLFAYPSCRLAVYGTLAPGQQHHSELASAPGTWTSGNVHGTTESVHGFTALRLGREGDVPVKILESPALPSLLSRLDAFEGDGYRRGLALVETAAGIVVANVYFTAA